MSISSMLFFGIQDGRSWLGERYFTDIRELLVQPAVRLVMPSEETENFDAGLRYTGEFDRLASYGSAKDWSHERGFTSYGRVFANEIAAPYMKDEKLRFPVGSMIVREKMLDPGAKLPELVSAMIKRERGFGPMHNDWEFVVIDKRFTRVKRGNDLKSCVECHANTRASDLVYKSYLNPK